MRLSLIYFVLTILTVTIPVMAKQHTYYLKVSSIKCGYQVRVNGFDVSHKKYASGNYVRAVDRCLCNGKNTLKILYLPTKNSTNYSSLHVKLISVPKGSSSGSKDAKILAKYSIGSEILDIYRAYHHKAIAPIIGGFVNNHVLKLSKTNNGYFVCAFRLTKGHYFTRIPSRLEFPSTSP